MADITQNGTTSPHSRFHAGLAPGPAPVDQVVGHRPGRHRHQVGGHGVPAQHPVEQPEDRLADGHRHHGGRGVLRQLPDGGRTQVAEHRRGSVEHSRDRFADTGGPHGRLVPCWTPTPTTVSRRRAASSPSTPPADPSPSSPTWACSPSSTGDKRRSAWPSATASSLTVVKDQGLVAAVFADRTLAGLHGHLAIGHCRYSTTGSSTWRNAQPAYRCVDERMFALGHNGNLVNTEALVKEAGMLEGTVTSDSDLVAELIAAELAHHPGDPDALEQAVADVIVRLDGAPPGHHGRGPGHRCARPPWVPAAVPRPAGRRGPTCWRPRRRRSTSWAQLRPRARPRRDGGHRRGRGARGPTAPDEVDPHLCLFEFVYFARPDSRLYGQSVHQARIRMGEQLAEQAPAEADMVMGVPESGVPAAEGSPATAGSRSARAWSRTATSAAASSPPARRPGPGRSA